MIEKMYNEFRSEIDKICTPEILKIVNSIKILQDDKVVGIFCYVRQDDWIYIDALYIKPEYRRKHVARNYILNWYEDFKDEEIRLHIINNNKPAYKFWTSLFRLKTIERNSIDTLYLIKGRKDDGK